MYVPRRILVPVRPASRPYLVAWNPQETMELFTLDQHGVTRYDWSSDTLPSSAEVEVHPHRRRPEGRPRKIGNNSILLCMQQAED